MRKIFISDYTLRKLNEEKKTLLFREKTAIAACIDGFGADAIEFAEIKKPKEDTIIYKTISSLVKNSAVCIPTGTDISSLAQAWECIKGAAHPRLQVILPVSAVQMEYKFHMKDAAMLKMISELCSAAKEKCEDVEFVAEDATRADEGFLVAALDAAKENGASEITLCDDAGILSPYEFDGFIKSIRAKTDVALYVKVSNCIDLATANALSALSAGADGVKTSVAGKDVLLAGKLSDVLKAKGESIGVYTSLKGTEIQSDIDTMLKKIDHTERESYAADMQENNGIFLTKDSTLTQTSDAVRKLGYDISEDDMGRVYEALVRLCEKKSSIGAKELDAVIASSAMQVPSAYHLESYMTSSGNLTASMSHVVLVCEDRKLDGTATGDGPIDSAFKAIEQSIQHHYELDDFQIQSVTEGKEALGSALVKLRNNGKLYSGNGISTDIVGASIRAYINALNKIAYEEKN